MSVDHFVLQFYWEVQWCSLRDNIAEICRVLAIMVNCCSDSSPLKTKVLLLLFSDDDDDDSSHSRGICGAYE